MRTVPCCRRLILSLAVSLLLMSALSALVHAEDYVLVKGWGTEGSGNGQFQFPRGVVVGPKGDVYVVDCHNHRIQRFTPDGEFLGKWGTEGFGNGRFTYPRSVAANSFGTVYVLEGERVQRFRRNGIFISKWGESGWHDGELYDACGVAVGPSGRVYVADTGNCRIQVFNAFGTFIRKWGCNGTGDGQFYRPYDVAVSPSGDVYVADTNHDRIQRFTATGGFLGKWGSQGSGDYQFYSPRSVAVDAQGNVYVAEGPVSLRIKKFSPDGSVLLAKWGDYRDAARVAVDALGNVYVTDAGRDRVLKYEPGKARPDMRVRLAGDPWSFDDVYGRAGTQTLATSVVEGETQVYQLSIQNDGNINDRFRIYGRGFSGRWNIRYFSSPPLPQDTTEEVTGGGWDCGVLAPGDVRRFTARITAPEPAEGDSRRSSAIRAVSQYDGETTDAVKIVLRVRKRLQPDAKIKLPGEAGGSGNNIYNTTGAGQYRKCTVAKGKKATFAIQNDGNVKGSFRIRGPGGNTKWRVRYFDALTGGTDITNQVVGDGWPTPELNAGKSQAMRVEVVPKRAAVGGDRAAVLVIATSGGKRPKKDAVKAITIVKSTASTSSCQLTSLAAVSTRAGVQITFTLSSSAQVEARALNVAGRPVATICHARECDAGTNTLLWDARSDQGLPVPNGTYLIEVAAKTEDGSQARALAQVNMRR